MPKTIDLIEDFDKAITQENYQALLDLLKQKNMDINYWVSRNNWTPLHLAIEANKPALVSLFLLMGANPNAHCARGSALDMACKKGNLNLVQCLLEDPRLKGVKITKQSEEANPKITIEYREVYSIHHYTLHEGQLTKEKSEVPKSMNEMNEIDEYDTTLANGFSEALKTGNIEKVETLLSAGNAYDDHIHSGFSDAVELGCFDLVNRMLHEGVYISHETLKKPLQSTTEPIKALVKLEKQKQIDLMQAYIENQENRAEFQKATEHVLNRHKASVDTLLRQKEEHVNHLLKEIKNLEHYGTKLITNGFSEKGTQVTELAQNILTQTENYLKKDSNKKEISTTLGKLLFEGKKAMGSDRNIRDKIAHIAFIFTGIGALILIGHKLFTGSFFLNRTHREQLLDNIHKDTKKIINASPGK